MSGCRFLPTKPGPPGWIWHELAPTYPPARTCPSAFPVAGSAGGRGRLLMAKIASSEDMSAVLWFCITFALCIGSMLIPIPVGRMVIALIVSFGLMIGAKIIADR